MNAVCNVGFNKYVAKSGMSDTLLLIFFKKQGCLSEIGNLGVWND